MTHRIEQVNKLIRRELSELIQRELKDPRLDEFVIVTDVSTSKDLRHARVYISHIGNEEQRREILLVLQSAAGFLRKEMNHNLRLRRIPELNFCWDNSIERGTHILQLIDQVSENDSKVNNATSPPEDPTADTASDFS